MAEVLFYIGLTLSVIGMLIMVAGVWSYYWNTRG